MSQDAPDDAQRSGDSPEREPAPDVPRTPHRVPRGARWTTRRWLGASLSAALVVLLALAGCGVWAFGRSADATSRLSDRSSPALVASVRLENALVNQETGVRGYGLAGQPEFLEPYREGLAQQKSAVDRLRALVGDEGRAAEDLDRVLERAGRWQRLIARPVAAAPSGRPVAVASARAREGMRAFDAVRSQLRAQQAHLGEERRRARDDLDHARLLQNWIFSAIAVLVLAMIALSVVGLRRAVTTPLERLASDVRAVALGDFGHPVEGTGPADLRLLASDIEDMRRRLLDELAFTDAARARLDAQATELQRSNSELEQFAYVASHDLQEPLRKVASFCQLLQRRNADQLDARAQQYIEFAVDGANRMQALINDLLAFSRVGRVHADHQEVDVQELFGRVLDSLSIAVEESGATVTHDPLPTIGGDVTQLGMLFQNLLSNAIKFRSPERPPVVHLSAREGDGRWHFAFSDNGIGIDPAYSEKVFVIFQRLHTRDTYEGTGIGLALCKKVVEYHGGSIGVDHDHSPGTRIVFTLAEPAPVESAPERPETASPGVATAS